MEKQSKDGTAQKKQNRKAKLFLMAAIYLVPLFVGRFQGNVIDQSMRLIGVRKESVTVLFQDDYKKFVDSSLNTKDKTLYEADIIFSAFGVTSVLQIEGRKFVVPNEKYFVNYE